MIGAANINISESKKGRRLKLKANANYRKFKAWSVSKLPDAVSLDRRLFRVAGPRHTSADAIVSGIGGWKANGRWCRQGVTKLIYTSESPETALRESNEHARRHNIALWRQMPKVVVAIDLKARAILDLASSTASADLPIELELLMAEDWRAENERGEESFSQALGRAAFAAGFDGLRVPSKPHPEGVNVVVFVRDAGATMTLLNADLLKQLGAG